MKRGIGSTLGVIFFIAILFSTIIPLQLFIKEHKHLLVRSINEMEVEDNYRELEKLYVLGYPVNLTSNQILVKVENKSPIPISVRRVWIKDEPNIVDTMLNPGNITTLGPFSITLEEDTNYGVKVSTNRGRLFTSETGNLAYINGTWITPTLGISVQIANTVGKYYIEVYNSTWKAYYKTLGQDQDDVLVFFDVKTNGQYSVICKKNSITGPDLPGTPTVVAINYPQGPPVVFIYTSGLDT
jgi:hypothetical protein